ncbi:MAG TPA: Fe-S cluster assembly protein SufD [Acidimicrobiia bacterium]|jgi:Fe-S cluster assembly protein SufD
MPSAFTPDASRGLGGPEWLAERRAAAAQRLGDLVLPTDTEEIWRYSRIGELDLERYRPRTADERELEVSPVPQGLRSKGVIAGDLHSIDAEGAEEWFGRCAGESPDAFTELHDAFAAGGAYIFVPPGVVVDEPVFVSHRSSGDGLASFPHTLVVVGEGAEVSIVDRFAAAGDHLTDAVIELVVGDGANVRYISVQEHGEKTWAIALQRARVGRDARLQSSAVALGGDYARLRSESLLHGEGGESDLLAVYFGDQQQMHDFRTLQDHAAPRTRSDLLFKGAVEDEARSVYSGLIRLRKSAQKANAFQTNRNLVLTEGAGAESIPNLEIEADDVRCSHASTVGPIDDDQLYYLESRGVSPADAERLIVLGFFEDVFARLPVPSLVAELRASVHEKLGRLHG